MLIRYTPKHFQMYCQRVCGRDTNLSYDDIQKLFNVSKRTLYNHKSSGKLLPLNSDSTDPRFHWGHVEWWARQTKRLWEIQDRLAPQVSNPNVRSLELNSLEKLSLEKISLHHSKDAYSKDTRTLPDPSLPIIEKVISKPQSQYHAH